MAPSYNFLTLIGPLCLMLISGTESWTNNEVTVQLACSSGPHTCADVQGSNPRPVVTLSNGLEVVCDTVTDNGGWIVMQRRASADVDFYLNWVDYKYGFGDVYGNFWLGLEKVHQLTFKRRYELRIDITFNGQDYYANYDNFTLFGEPENYRIRVSGYSGNSSDGLGYHNDRPFTTKDRDNDAHGTNCAAQFHGAWWYGACHNSNLNGKWGSHEYAEGLTWDTTTGDYDTPTFTEMKIRPLDS
ncbi:ficolin-1 [Aplysia californica]|uniref:Ficolin-1 n=1 Tax=Aplysia californica TaxID=6500 RepID=A0ABM0JGR8_APLCA|nr:ficolin-1 [Aplysia californica]